MGITMGDDGRTCNGCTERNDTAFSNDPMSSGVSRPVVQRLNERTSADGRPAPEQRRRSRGTEGDLRWRESVKAVAPRSNIVRSAASRGYRGPDPRIENLPSETPWVEPEAPSAFVAALTMKPCRMLMGLP